MQNSTLKFHVFVTFPNFSASSQSLSIKKFSYVYFSWISFQSWAKPSSHVCWR